MDEFTAIGLPAPNPFKWWETTPVAKTLEQVKREKRNLKRRMRIVKASMQKKATRVNPHLSPASTWKTKPLPR